LECCGTAQTFIISHFAQDRLQRTWNTDVIKGGTSAPIGVLSRPSSRLCFYGCVCSSLLSLYFTLIFFLPRFVSFPYFVFASTNLCLSCFYQSDIFVTFYCVCLFFLYYNLLKITMLCCIVSFFSWFLSTTILNLP